MRAAFRAITRGGHLAASILLLAIAARADDIVLQPTSGEGFVVRDAVGVTDQLRVDEDDGDIHRAGARFLHTTGTDSTYVGANAGAASTGSENTVLGASALSSNASGTQNTAVGAGALFLNTANGNTAVGAAAMAANTTGTLNAAFGNGALTSNDTGAFNSAFGAGALLLGTGSNNSAFGALALDATTTGSENTAVGSTALSENETGVQNTAVGFGALGANLANGNTAVGNTALNANTTGFDNAALGNGALASNGTGSSNSAVGSGALLLGTGSSNTAVGAQALAGVTSGSNNLVLGAGSGANLSSGSDNIYIASPGPPVVTSENATLRIGDDSNIAATLIAGIHGDTSSGGIQVYVNSNGRLGTATSSRRFKEAVRDIDTDSRVIHRLRPVAFRYREEYGGDGASQEYGLIAEEVVEVAPNLVVRDETGAPLTVRYHLLVPMLLNELQHQDRIIAAQRDEVEAQGVEVARLAERLRRLEVRLAGDPTR